MPGLPYLEGSDWPVLVRGAIAVLHLDPKNDAAATVINCASLQATGAVQPHLEELFQLSSTSPVRIESFVWRSAGISDVEHLRQALKPVEGAATTFDPDMDEDLAISAFDALLETRNPKALQTACAAAPQLDITHDGLKTAFWNVDIELRDGEFRKLTTDTVRHIQFQNGYVGRPCYLDLYEYPTWEQLSPDAYRYRFGGLLDSPCGSCGSALHHVITLDPVPERTMDTSVPKLAVATCLTCAPNFDGYQFYTHDEYGLPAARFQSSRISETFARPIAETMVALTETPERWRGQDIGFSDGQNMHRIGGHPCWWKEAQFPNCPQCDVTMPFLMQLNSHLMVSDDSYMMWRDRGTAYFYWCDACRISAMSCQSI